VFEVAVHETAGLDRRDVPITFGVRVPLRQSDSNWQLTDGGQHLPTQSSSVDTAFDAHTLRIDAILKSIRGNERKTLLLAPAPKSPSLNPHPYSHLTQDGLDQLTVHGFQYLCEPSGYLIIGASGSGIAGSANAPQSRRRETIRPSSQSIELLSQGEVLEFWVLRGTIGDDDGFEFHTNIKIHKHHPRIDVHTRLRNRWGPRYISHFAHALHLTKPDHAEVLARDLAFDHMVDVNLSAQTLRSGWSQSGVRLCYADNSDLVIMTQDFDTFDDGMMTLTNVGRDQDSTDLTVHRIEPVWHYRGITSHAPIRHLHFHEGQTRSASFSLIAGTRDQTEERLVATEDGLSVYVLDEPTAKVSNTASLLNRTLERALGFTVPAGEYQGLLAGGRCHINHRLIEFGVNRADYAEYLLRHFTRTGDPRLLQVVTSYADRFVDLSIHRSDQTPDTWGALRQRYRENLPDRVRSMRGTTFLLNLFDLTGDDRYHSAAFEIGRYLLKSFPDRFARQGGACRELATLYKRTSDESYLQKAHEILDEVARSQLPEGSWYEYYEPDVSTSTLDVHQAGLYTIEATEKPEMSSYNIIGILDSRQTLDLDPWLGMIEKACDWMVDVQDEEGAWRFPRYDSEPQWGHGIFQDVLAMLLAYMSFNKPAYLESADRGVAWAERIWDQHGYIPSVTHVTPHRYLEASLTYFYGIEALSIRSEL
jgi:hypothetical protein